MYICEYIYKHYPTDELPTSYRRVTNELPLRIILFLLHYDELPLKIKYKKLLSIFFYILMVTRGNSL